MAAYAFHSDGSEYAGSLLDGLELLDIAAVLLESPSELESPDLEPLSAVVLANPPTRLARETRASMNRAGGWMSRVPLITTMGSMDRLEDTDTLRVVDDFMVAPGGAGELVSRVKVVALRRGGEGEAVVFGELVINLEAHQVFLDIKPVDLTFKEFELLRKLAGSPGKAFTREELLRGIWGYDYFGGTRTVDVHVRRLRAKIEGKRSYIETVHGVGYRFVSA